MLAYITDLHFIFSEYVMLNRMLLYKSASFFAL